MKFQYRILLPILLICHLLFIEVLSQNNRDDDGFVTLFGYTYLIKDNKNLEGVTISVFKNSKLVKKVTTNKRGKYSIKLDYQEVYDVFYSYPEHITCYLELSTKVPQSDLPYWHNWEAIVPLYEKNLEGVNIDIFKIKPFTKIGYDTQAKRFAEDRFYMIAFEEELNKVVNEEDRALTEKMKQAERRSKQATAEKAKKKKEQETIAQKQEDTAVSKVAVVISEQVEDGNVKIDTNEVAYVQAAENNKSLEEEKMELLKEKEVREQEIMENKVEKEEYMNELLEIAKKNKQQATTKKYAQLKATAETNATIERMKSEKVMKLNVEPLLEEEQKRQKERIENSQITAEHWNKLMVTAATNERNRKKQNLQKSDINAEIKPDITQKIKEETFKTIITTKIKYPLTEHVYYKVEYAWGMIYYYKNEEVIDEETYIKEMSEYLELPKEKLETK